MWVPIAANPCSVLNCNTFHVKQLSLSFAPIAWRFGQTVVAAVYYSELQYSVDLVLFFVSV